MKKIKVITVILTVALVCAFAFLSTACTSDPQKPIEGLSSQKVDEIRRAYIDLEFSGLDQVGVGSAVVEGYFGTFGGVMAVQVHDVDIRESGMIYLDDWIVEVHDYIIDGVFIDRYGSPLQNPNFYTYPYPYYAYFDPQYIAQDNHAGRLTSLDEAYYDGYLTKDDLKQISENIKSWHDKISQSQSKASYCSERGRYL